MEALLILLGLFFLLVLPALAIGAFTRAQRLRREFDELSQHTYRSLTNRLYELEKKITALEKRLAGEAAPVAAPAPDVAPEPAPWRAPPIEVASPLPAAPPPKAPSSLPPRPTSAPAREVSPPPRSIDWETLIAGRWMNIVGILALILAVSFFLKYAFENNWIGPAGRVALGLVGGVALLVFSQWLLRKKYVYFSEGMAGLGGGVLYLSLYAAWSYYNLFPQTASFIGMIVVTLALMLLAAGRDSQRIALLALAGGFLTPVLLRTGVDRQIALFSYLAALDAGLLVLARLRQWRIVEPAAFVATQMFFWGWYEKFWAAEKLVPTALFATVFFLLFSALPLVRLRRTAALAPGQLVLVLSNAFAFLLALRAVFWPDHRWTLTFAVLALAALHLLVAQRIPRAAELKAAGVPLARLLYAGLALTFATLAIPIRLEGRWITLAWALEGAVLIWSGFAGRVRQLRYAGLALLGVVLFRLIAFPIAGERFLLNARFTTLVMAALCFAAAAWFARSRREDYFAGERYLYGGAVVAANALLLWALSVEIWKALGRLEQPLGMRAWDAQPLSLALLWTLYGTLLIAGGFLKNLPGLRWQGLPLLAVAAGWLLQQSARQETFLANPRFIAFALAVVCVFVLARLARDAKPPPPEAERALYRGAPVAMNLLLLVALSREVWDLFGRIRTIEDVHLAQSMGLSLLWAIYAAVLIFIGVRAASALRRWMGIVLLCATVAKVFLSDLAFLVGIYRILSVAVLGLALMIVSFYFTRRLARRKSESPG